MSHLFFLENHRSYLTLGTPTAQNSQKGTAWTAGELLEHHHLLASAYRVKVTAVLPCQLRGLVFSYTQGHDWSTQSMWWDLRFWVVSVAPVVASYCLPGDISILEQPVTGTSDNYIQHKDSKFPKTLPTTEETTQVCQRHGWDSCQIHSEVNGTGICSAKTWPCTNPTTSVLPVCRSPLHKTALQDCASFSC